MRLSAASVDALPPEVDRYGYDREDQAIGIVHFGIGAFHRAHQAWYTDLAMDAGERDWAICGVSLRSAEVSKQLDPQDGLYTLTERCGSESRTRVVGALREVLFAGDRRAEVIARIAAPPCRLVSFTVTEKGYCRNAGGDLDLRLAEGGFYPLLGEALAQRAERDLPGVTLLSCDNLAENGAVLTRLMRQWLQARQPDLLDWFDANCTAPSTMVDRIVPRSAPEDIAALTERTGMADHGAVFTERFSQWVIENRFVAGHPAWQTVGAQLVDDVAPYETAKLRMLNGAHSLLAYCGLAAGYAHVHEAMADPDLATLARRLMLEEARPTIHAADDQGLAAYAEDLAARFADPVLRHRLAQIAMDGTQKLPQRWLDTALWHHDRGGDAPAIRQGFAAWFRHCAEGTRVDDPHGEALTAAARTGGWDAFLDLCFGTIWPDHATARVPIGPR